jgi:VWFA-related protein
MKLRAMISLFVLFSLSVSTFGQTPSPTIPTTEQEPKTKQTKTSKDDDDVVRLNVDLVQVDAVVTDKEGKQVTDLTSDDFEIYQDGRLQKITTFTYIKVEDQENKPKIANEKKPGIPIPPPPSGKLNPENVRRTIALVVDDLGLSHSSSVYVRQALRKFVDENMQPGDLVAIIRTGAGMGALQQFTADKRLLYAAIEKVKYNLNSRSSISTFAPIRNDSLPIAGDRNAGLDGRQNTDIFKVDKEQLGSVIDDFREEVFSVGTLGAVNYVVRGMRELPGRKAVVLFSDGFKLYTNDPGSHRVVDSLKRLIDLANRSSVVFYTIDPRGVVTTSFSAADNLMGSPVNPLNPNNALTMGDPTHFDFLGNIATSQLSRSRELFETQQGLSYLAEQTGGFMVKNNNDIPGAVRKVLVDQKGYYILGYQPDEETFRNKKINFHKLSVKVKRSGLRVRSRTGFFGVTNDESRRMVRRSGTEQIYAALTSPFSKNDIELRMTSMFGYDFQKGSFAQSLIHINAKDLTFTPEKKDDPNTFYKSTINIMAVTFGDNGQVFDQNDKYYTLRISGAELERNLDVGLIYNVSLLIKKPGAYQLRLAVMDNVTLKVGSATQYIEIPDVKKGNLTLSGMTIAAISEQATMQQAADKPNTVSEFSRKASLAERKFKRGMSLEYAYYIYNAKADKSMPQLETQVRLFRDSKEIFTGQRRPIDLSGQTNLKQIIGRGVLRLGTELQPDDYVLQIVVFDKLSKEKNRIATQSVDFEIVK